MHITSPENLANYLRDLRKMAQISQAEVAKRIGLKQGTVSSFENKPSSTKCETLFKILAALEIELHVTPRKSHVTKQMQREQEW